MPKKHRAQRRRRNRNEDADGWNSSSDNETNGAQQQQSYHDDKASADYLSESHTIDMQSHVGSTLASIEDDLEWDMDGDDDHKEFMANRHADDDVAAAAERRRQQKLDTVLATAEGFAQEKRSAKREQLLKQWFKALTQYATSPPYETVQHHRDFLLDSVLQHVLLRGAASPAEQYAACRVIEAMGVLLGSDHQLYEQTQLRLTRTIQSTHRATPVRAAALRALGMVVFCGDDVDDVVVESVMDLCESIILTAEYRGQATPPILKAAAFQVWTVLATTLHVFYVAGNDDATTGRGLPLLDTILECLEEGSTAESALQLKEAAGQAVVYILDARIRLGASQVENTTDAQYKPGTFDNTEYETIMEEITQAVYQLAHASGHHMSKRTKKEQRHVFRDYLAMLQDNEDPLHIVQCRGGNLELTTWKDVISLEYMKRCLQGGFQVQLMSNPTLHYMLGANGDALSAMSGYSQLEKRLLWSKNSEAAKVKDLQRHKGRDKRTNIKNHFLTADGDDM